MKYIILILTLLSFPAFAYDSYDWKNEPDYTPYLKLSVGRVINQPDDITNSKTKERIPLFQGDNFNYSIEMGISVKKDDSNKEFRLGLGITDLLNQGDSSKYMSPYKVEVFGDHVINYSKGYFTSIGVGYKIACDSRVVSKARDPDFLTEEEYFKINEGYLGKITARFSIGRNFKHYTLSLDHHSQYFTGKPVNNEWEYHVTSFNISKTF